MEIPQAESAKMGSCNCSGASAEGLAAGRNVRGTRWLPLYEPPMLTGGREPCTPLPFDALPGKTCQDKERRRLSHSCFGMTRDKKLEERRGSKGAAAAICGAGSGCHEDECRTALHTNKIVVAVFLFLMTTPSPQKG